MAVDLEELALKSIEQYATLGVRLESLERAIRDSNARFEQSQEKFIAACDKLSRLEEKISAISEDKTVVHKRIDDTRAEVDKLIVLVKDLTDNVKQHKDNHCSDCVNNNRIEEAHELIEEHISGDKTLTRSREIISSQKGLMFLEFSTTKWGYIWFGAVSANVILSFVAHYELIKGLWGWMQFK